MNAEAPTRGLAGILRSLNCDRAYGLALLAACALLLLPELGGDAARIALRYERIAVAGGEWWRLLTAHVVHLDAEHAILNSLGLVLMWALFARDYSPLRWLLIVFASGLAIGICLWFFSPEIEWYVGASGVLHGVMTAGTLAHLRRRDLDSLILAAFIVGKLAYEQFAGAMPFTEGISTVIDAHLYGAIGGLLPAFFLRSLPGPQPR